MITIQQVNKQFGGQVLFEDVSFALSSGDKIGLIGRNGSGKTTLLRMILGQDYPDSGKVSVPRNYTLGTLAQEYVLSKQTVLEECTSQLDQEDESQVYQVKKILMGLGFTDDDLLRAPQTFSSGYQLRIQLAVLLTKSPNCLLLDEPTNYLDIVSMRWLKRFLISYPHEFIIITHDKGFMNEVVNRVLGIHRQKIVSVRGNFDQYERQIALEDETYESNRLNTERKAKQLQTFIDRFRAQATKASSVQSKVKLLEKLDMKEKLENVANVRIRFNYSSFPTRFMGQVEKLEFGYTPTNIIINNFNLAIEKNDRIAIIGKNGIGKSTLLNLISKTLTPLKGQVNFHTQTIIGHFAHQYLKDLDPSKSVYEEIMSSNPMLTNTQIRGICGQLMFSGTTADKRIAVLSGGEKARVLMGKIIARPCNLLLLDEPTHHLDSQSIDILVDQLHKFEGAVVIVSHSEQILRQLASKIVIFQNGTIQYLEGDYDYFLEKIGWADEAQSSGQTKEEKRNRKEEKRNRSQMIALKSQTLNPIKKEIERIEKTITSKETLVTDLNQQLLDAAMNQESSKITTLPKQIKLLEAEIEALYDILQDQSDALEEVSKQFADID